MKKSMAPILFVFGVLFLVGTQSGLASDLQCKNEDGVFKLYICGVVHGEYSSRKDCKKAKNDINEEFRKKNRELRRQGLAPAEKC